MSLRAIPLIAIAFIIYNVVVLVSGVDALTAAIVPEIPMLSGGRWRFTFGDLIILLTLILLFIEIVKSTYTSTSTLVDHGLSMLVFVVALVEFLLVPQAATSVFFILLAAMLIDVIAGYTIGIRVARRDLNLGGDI